MPSSKVKLVRRTLADGSVKEYRYSRTAPAAKASRAQPGTVDALIEAWRRSPEWADLAPATQVNYALYLRDLYRLGSLAVGAVRRRDIIAVRNAIALTRGKGAATGFIRAASAAFTWGMDNDLAEVNPAHRIKPLKRGTLPAWTEEVLALALEKLPEAYRRVVILAAHTGQRRGDLCALTWSAYDPAAGTITLRQEKDRRVDKEPLVIPVHRELRRHLDEWRQARTATTILTNPSGQPWTRAHLSREMGKKVAQLGLGRFTPHGLRKLCANRLAQAGCSTHQIAAICGWRSLSMVQHYTRAADQEGLAQAAVIRLENAGRGKRGKRSLKD
jgi:integrase